MAMVPYAEPMSCRNILWDQFGRAPDATRDEIGDRAVAEYATRHADDTAKGIDRAREILADGDVGVAAHVLGESLDSVARVSPLR